MKTREKVLAGALVITGAIAGALEVADRQMKDLIVATRHKNDCLLAEYQRETARMRSAVRAIRVFDSERTGLIAELPEPDSLQTDAERLSALRRVYAIQMALRRLESNLNETTLGITETLTSVAESTSACDR